MKNKSLALVAALQGLYIFMFCLNIIGYLNMWVNNLGYVLWGIVAVSSLILSIVYFLRIDRKKGIPLSIISLIEVGFTIFIIILPYIVGIPF